MNLSTSIQRLRTEAKWTQEEFSERFGVSQQAVQKWESGRALPELKKLVEIADHFGVSLDELILGRDRRTSETSGREGLRPRWQDLPDWEFYASALQTEFCQSSEEGLEIERYGEVFAAVSKLPKGEIKKKLADVLFETVIGAEQRADYPYREPDDPGEIRQLRPEGPVVRPCAPSADKVHGAWMGRICGCLLGKTVEGIRTNELIPFLRATGNLPLRRYILRSDLTEALLGRFSYPFAERCYADEIDGMPSDDDTNYVVLAQEVVRTCGRAFTPADVAAAWLKYQNKEAYCTAERVAYCNFIKGYAPPQSALFQNPYREWIGAQIRGDYFGYINPGDPESAAEMARRDASISHVKNGIYGEMFAAAMLAAAAAVGDLETVVRCGLAQIPRTSRLAEGLNAVLDAFGRGAPQAEVFGMIHSRFDEYTEHGWCHVIPNAMIVTAALLYGGGDFGRSVCMAVETGFDTDCNGATVGSVIGMARGLRGIPAEWRRPVGDTLHTTLFGVGSVSIADRVRLTMAQMPPR